MRRIYKECSASLCLSHTLSIRIYSPSTLQEPICQLFSHTPSIEIFVPRSTKYQVLNMKSFTISAALTLLAAALVHAAPVVEARTFAAQITFEGATPEAQFTQYFPVDGTVVKICKSSTSPVGRVYCWRHPVTYIFIPRTTKKWDTLLISITDNPLSISHIKSLGGAVCSFVGIDGTVTERKFPATDVFY